MSNQRPFQGFVASLSNGETYFEYPTKRGELSAWQFLLQRIKVDNLRITQLRLQRGGRTVTAMPGADGYFQAYEARISNNARQTSLYQGIGSVVAGHVFITWVNAQGDVWHDVRPHGEVWVHTDKRQLVDIL